jgi:hypothetical protein
MLAKELIGVKIYNPDLLGALHKSYKISIDTYKSPNLIGEIVEVDNNWVTLKFRDYEQKFSTRYIIEALKLN